MAYDIRHDKSAQRFETDVDGALCELDYRLDGAVMTLIHTGVPAPVAGRGIAGELVRAALDTARDAGWKVVPACSYAAVWMQRHPKYNDLRT